MLAFAEQLVLLLHDDDGGLLPIQGDAFDCALAQRGIVIRKGAWWLLRSRRRSGRSGAAHPGENFYGEEEFGGQRYFTAIYPDRAVAEACISCHNGHKDSPRRDAEVGDVMGGGVIRIPMD